MTFITADRVRDTSTTTGTGNITVSGSAPFGYRTFSTVLSVSDTFYYCIQGQSTSEWEVGLGTYSSANVFARTTVLSSSASGSAVSFSSGTKDVFITLAADKTLQIGPSSSVTVPTVIGGTAASSSLTLQSTSGVGTSDSILFKVGNNGATTAMTIDTSGNVGINMVPTYALDLTVRASNGIRLNASSGQCIMFFQQAGVTNGTLNASGGAGTDFTVSAARTLIVKGGTSGIQFYSNGTQYGVWDASGNVGIGTTSTGNKLEAAGTIRATQQTPPGSGTGLELFYYPATTTGYIIAYDRTASTYKNLSINNSINIDTSGNVGIATGNLTFSGTGQRITGDFSSTSPISNRVLFQTSTTNATTIVSAIPNGTGTQSNFNVYNNSDAANASDFRLLINSTDARLLTAYSGTGSYLPMTFYTGGSERMRIDSSGNALIGLTASKTYGNTLQVQGGIQNFGVNSASVSDIIAYDYNSVDASPTFAGAALRKYGSTATGNLYIAGTIAAAGWAEISGINTNGLGIGTNGAAPIVFGTTATERMRIDSSGNVIAGGSVALATTATNGFLYVPTCAGTPTGTPTTVTGMAPIVVNTTNNKLYFYSGGAWRDAGP